MLIFFHQRMAVKLLAHLHPNYNWKFLKWHFNIFHKVLFVIIWIKEGLQWINILPFIKIFTHTCGKTSVPRLSSIPSATGAPSNKSCLTARHEHMTYTPPFILWFTSSWQWEIGDLRLTRSSHARVLRCMPSLLALVITPAFECDASALITLLPRRSAP